MREQESDDDVELKNVTSDLGSRSSQSAQDKTHFTKA